MIDGEEVNLGGTRFRVEVVSPTHKKLHPIDDPMWMLRALEGVRIREEEQRTADAEATQTKKAGGGPAEGNPRRGVKD